MAIASTQSELKELYDKDFPLWAEINLNLLKEKKYDQVDWENLLEEIEDMSRSDLKECISYLAGILEHLYKWDNFRDIADQRAGAGKGGRKWIKEIENLRDDIIKLFKLYPSLRSKLPLEVDKAWIDAISRLRKWLRENDYDPDTFNIPEQCPYTYEEAMKRDVRKESDVNYWMDL